MLRVCVCVRGCYVCVYLCLYACVYIIHTYIDVYIIYTYLARNWRITLYVLYACRQTHTHIHVQIVVEGRDTTQSETLVKTINAADLHIYTYIHTYAYVHVCIRTRTDCGGRARHHAESTSGPK